jgi:hypothetical protein
MEEYWFNFNSLNPEVGVNKLFIIGVSLSDQQVNNIQENNRWLYWE